MYFIFEYDNFFQILFSTYDMDKCTKFMNEFMNTAKTIIDPEVKYKMVQVIVFYDVLGDFCEFFVQSKDNLPNLLQLLSIFNNI